MYIPPAETLQEKVIRLNRLTYLAAWWHKATHRDGARRFMVCVRHFNKLNAMCVKLRNEVFADVPGVR